MINDKNHNGNRKEIPFFHSHLILLWSWENRNPRKKIFFSSNHQTLFEMFFVVWHYWFNIIVPSVCLFAFGLWLVRFINTELSLVQKYLVEIIRDHQMISDHWLRIELTPSTTHRISNKLSSLPSAGISWIILTEKSKKGQFLPHFTSKFY